MSGFWNMIDQNLVTHADAYWVGALAILAAAAKCLPKPGSQFNWLTIYTWFYDTVQSVIPVPRNSQSGNGNSSGEATPKQPVYPPPTEDKNPSTPVATPATTK